MKSAFVVLIPLEAETHIFPQILHLNLKSNFLAGFAPDLFQPDLAFLEYFPLLPKPALPEPLFASLAKEPFFKAPLSLFFAIETVCSVCFLHFLQYLLCFFFSFML